MRAKQINEEGIGDILQPKELSGLAKKIYDAKENLNSLGIKTTEIETDSIEVGYVSFDLKDHNLKNRIIIKFIDEKLYNAGRVKKIIKGGWILTNYNDTDKTSQHFNSWNEIRLIIFKILYNDIDREIEEDIETLGRLENGVQNCKESIEYKKKIKTIINAG